MSSFRQPHTATNYDSGSFANGYWQGDNGVDVDILASVQPAPDKIRKNTPVGMDADSTLLVITDTLLSCAEAGSQKSTTIALFSKTYQVHALERWQNQVIPHYEYMAVRPKQ